MSLRTRRNRTSRTRFFPTTGFPLTMTGGLRFSQCIQRCDAPSAGNIIEELRRYYRLTEVIDYSRFEEEGCCLEGTGSLVLDHVNKIAYVSLSNRSDPKVIRRFADDFGYEPVTFTSIGMDGQLIYHTNVMMCVGDELCPGGACYDPE